MHLRKSETYPLACTSSSDVFIAGAGPAGLAAAIAVALQGLTVHIADGMEPPIDKACGEGLMPDAIAALETLGITSAMLAAAPGHPIHGIRFLGASSTRLHASTEAAFPAGPGLGIKRTHLHKILFDRATALGVQFSWRTVVQGIEGGIVRTNRFSGRPRFIVGADGHASRIRSCAGLDRASTTSRRVGLRQHFAIAPWTSHVEVYWSDHGQAYLTPVSSSEVCVAFVDRQKFVSVPQALAYFPLLQQRLADAPVSDPPRGAVTLSRTLHRVIDGNIALLGDASGSVDAITGEGLNLSFRQALALAHAIKANDLRTYQRAHRDIRRMPHFMSRTMLFMDRTPQARARALNAFERRPQLFSQLLQAHLGHTPLRLFGATGLIATGAHILAG